MGNIKRKSVAASILLEALIAMSVFALITSLLLGEISHSRQEQAKDLKEEQVLSVAQIALQARQSQLNLNGIQVEVERTARSITVRHQGKVVVHVD